MPPVDYPPGDPLCPTAIHRRRRFTPADDGVPAAVRYGGTRCPLVEEVVKAPVVKEVLRIRKESVTRPRAVTETLRREELDVCTRGEADIRVDDAPPA